MELQLRKCATTQIIKQYWINKKALILIVLKLKPIYPLAKCKSSYYSVSYGAGALKIYQDTEYQKVGEQHI